MRRLENKLTGMIYLNNAAAGWPKAPGVAEAVRQAMEQAPAMPGRENTASQAWVECARQRVAKFLAVEEAHRIVFTLNATHALNMAIRGLDLPDGALVVTTAAEHNSVLRPLAHLRRERAIRLKIVAVEPGGSVDLDDYQTALREEPALVAVSHASNVTGVIQDAASLLGMAKRVGATTLLDASQSAGHLPICPRRLHADLLVFQAYKGLHGPEGVGVLYVDRAVELRHTVTGGTGVRSNLELHPSEMPWRLEAGTATPQGWPV